MSHGRVVTGRPLREARVGKSKKSSQGVSSIPAGDIESLQILVHLFHRSSENEGEGRGTYRKHCPEMGKKKRGKIKNR